MIINISKICFVIALFFTLSSSKASKSPATQQTWLNQQAPVIQGNLQVLTTFEEKEYWKNEANRLLEQINQKHFGESEFLKAQRELMHVNRPLMGVVKHEADSLSQKEYERKILGTRY